jgi:membrane-bound lytic murein transglycosylase MltF
MRLTYEQVRQLVEQNNHSNFSTALLICLIWKESGFVSDAKNPNSSATGLMMMTRDAVTDVNANTPKGVHFEHSEMTDQTKNVSCGTYYLSILRRRFESDQVTLEHFGTGAGYTTKLFPCEQCISAETGTDAPAAARKMNCLYKVHP